MSLLRFPSGNSDYVMIFTLVLVSLSMVSCLERDFSQDSRYYARRLIPVDTPNNYYQLFHDMEPWKRAPSAGWFGMRGKKVLGSNFFGMRGKKGPSGFLGMRGKKMGPPEPSADSSNEQFAPVDTFEDLRTLPAPKSLYVFEDLRADRHNNGPQENRLLENSVTTNFGKINI